MSVDNDTVDIRVLSQLPEPHSILSFDNLSARTTVIGLKHHILRALPSRPQPEVQRLICRGRLLTRDGDTLFDVLGRETIQSREPQSIHLVIRDTTQPSVPSPASGTHATLPANAANPPPVPPGIAQLIGRPPSVPAFGPPGAQPTIVIAGGAPPQGLAAPVPLPLGFGPTANLAGVQQMAVENHRRAHEAFVNWQRQQQHQQQQLQQAQQQQQQQGSAGANTLAVSGAGTPLDPTARVNTPSSTAPTLEQQQQGSATHATVPSSAPAANTQAPAANPTQTAQAITNAAPPALPHQNQRWTFTFNASNMPMQQQAGFNPFMMPQPMMFGYPGMPFNVPTPPSTAPIIEGSPIENLDILQGQLEQLASDLRSLVHDRISMPNLSTAHLSNAASPEAQLRTRLHTLITTRNAQQEQINSIMAVGPRHNQRPLSPEEVAALQDRNDSFRRTVRSTVEGLDRLSEATRSQSAATAVPAAATESSNATSTSSTAAVDQQAVSVYLLSGLSGPNAIVYTPSGTFASIPQAPAATNNLTPSVSHASFQEAFRNLRYASRQATRAPSRNQNPTAEPQDNANAQPDVAQPQPQQQNDAGQQQLMLQQPFQPQGLPAVPNNHAPAAAADNGMDLGLAPFFRALWLFIRAYGIFWFFLGGTGNSTRRTILLISLTIIYWAYQAGLFQSRIDYLQRRWDGLVRLPDSVARAAGAVPPNTNERLAQGTFTPEEAARRLLEERRQREGTFRARLRTIERALVLFVISFWPGGGERLVAERERLRREADDQRQRDAAAATERDRAAAAATATESTDQGEETGVLSLAATEGQPPEKPQAEATAISNVDAGEGTSSSIEVGESSNTLTERRGAGQEGAST